MNVRIEVEQQIDLLHKQKWIFHLLDHALVLTSWYSAERKTIRHKKYETAESYSTYSHENRDDSNVPLPDWVKEKAIEKFLAGLKIGKWSEIRGKR